MEVIGSLLTFCDSTRYSEHHVLKNLGVLNLICVTGDILLRFGRWLFMYVLVI